MANHKTGYIDFLQKKEKVIFYSILLLNIAFLFVTKFYPSMDGPAHLYNANLLKDIFLDNQFIESYYQISSIPVPNWSSHFILSFFGLLFPGWLAEKFFLILYVSGMAISFRLLIKALKPENLAMSVFIFPFIYSFLFHLGFYNYTLSFIFFFLTLAFWINNYKANQFSLHLITGVLLLVTYFSNILTFGFLGITLGCVTIYNELKSDTKNTKQLTIRWAKRLGLLAVCALPGLMLLFVFFQETTFAHSAQENNINELIQWINDVRPLIVYGYQVDVVYTEQIFHVILLIIFISLVLTNNKVKIKDNLPNLTPIILWFPVCLTLILYFVLPNDSSAGMMSDRLCLLLFIYLIIIAALRNLPVKIMSLFYVIIILLHFSLLIKHTTIIRNLDKDAISINEAAQYIEENTVILPINLSDNWLQPHFSNYLGIDKPLVILENYEANVGWFPIRWNPDSPSILLGERKEVNGLTWHQSKNSSTQRPIDYIFLYGNLTKREDSRWQELNAIIDSGFTLEYESENKYIQLFKRNAETGNR